MNAALETLASRGIQGGDSLPDVGEALLATCRALRTRMSSRAGQEFSVVPAVVQSVPLRDLLAEAQSEPAVYIGTCTSRGQLAALMVFPGTLLARVVGAMLGEGESSALHLRSKKPISDLEHRMARRMSQDLVSGLQSRWPDPLPGSLQVQHADVNHRFVSEELHGHSVVSAELEMSIGESALGSIQAALLVSGNQSPMAASPTEVSDRITRRAMKMPLELVAELARLEIPLSGLRTLAPGDLFPLGPSPRPLMRVHGKAILRGEAGVSSGYNSVRVLDRLL